MILKLFLLSLCVGITCGFLCHACSYGGVDLDKGSNTACLNSVDNLPISSHIKCGNFCVTAEVFDLNKKIVTSFTRTCSVDWGNTCTEDTWWVTCKTSCVGNYCNRGVMIDPNSKEAPTVCDPFYGCGGHNPFSRFSPNSPHLFVIVTGILASFGYHFWTIS